jgi:hypothetical protein
MSKDGGPAFPYSALQPDEKTRQLVGTIYADNVGMTLRDYFAAKAMQGICAGRDEAGELIRHGYYWIASEAYTIADAMLKVRST